MRKPYLSLLVLMMLLCACGSTHLGAAPPPPDLKPDTVKISMFNTGVRNFSAMTVVVADSSVVKKFFSTIYGLPTTDKQGPCTLDAGPEYTIELRTAGKAVANVRAENSGCRYVTIGQNDVRTASGSDLFKLISETLTTRIKQIQPDTVEIFAFKHDKSLPTSSINKTDSQTLYQKLITGQEENATDSNCTRTDPYYQLSFQQGEEQVQALAFSGECPTVQMRLMGVAGKNTPFWQQFSSVLKTASFKPVQPNQLAYSGLNGGVVLQERFTDRADLIRRTYSHIPGLPLDTQCKRQDTGEYILTIARNNTILLTSMIYQKSCEKSLTRIGSNENAGFEIAGKPDAQLWSLLKEIERT